jgi:hypothetical protein
LTRGGVDQHVVDALDRIHVPAEVGDVPAPRDPGAVVEDFEGLEGRNGRGSEQAGNVVCFVGESSRAKLMGEVSKERE